MNLHQQQCKLPIFNHIKGGGYGNKPILHKVIRTPPNSLHSPFPNRKVQGKLDQLDPWGFVCFPVGIGMSPSYAARTCMVRLTSDLITPAANVS